ncbi:MAG TPA: TIR domain-containing protein [Caulobacterales bacterium]|nr:TIR domain-containing protein [Caulobacterales bacterium]
MSHVLLAHAPGEEERAALVAEKLDALGYKVRQDADIARPLSPFERRKLAAEIDAAACVLVLWSREAAETPSLRAAAARALAQRKLAVARLDFSAPPVRGAANLVNWLGNEQSRAWRQVLGAVGAAAKPRATAQGAAPRPAAAANAPAPAPARAEKKGGGAGLALMLLVLIAAGGAAAAHFVMHLF